MASVCFGNGIPQFIGTGDPDSTTRVLYYSRFVDTQFSENIMQMFQSPISAVRTWKHKGEHALFAVEVLLYKYTSNPRSIVGLPAAKTFLSTLFTYKNKDVKFYLSTDGPPLKNTAGAEITCHVVSIMPAFEDMTTFSNDKAVIVFKTNEPYDLSKALI